MHKRNLLNLGITFALLSSTPFLGIQAQAQSQAQPQAQSSGAKLKIGFMLPATGTYAALGTAIDNGFRLYVAEQGPSPPNMST